MIHVFYKGYGICLSLVAAPLVTISLDFLKLLALITSCASAFLVEGAGMSIVCSLTSDIATCKVPLH